MRQRVPFVLLVPALLGLGLLVLPLIGLLVRAPWSDLWPRLTAPAVGVALRLSLLSASCATLLSLLLGVPLAWLLARVEFRGRRLLRALVILPLVLPPVVGGVALLLVFGRRGLLGGLLADVGVTLPFSMPGVILAETFVAMPFLVIAVEGALLGADRRYEEAAATLGAGRVTAFRRITLPLIWPGVVAGAVLCWARALGEFGATITFAGNFPGRTQTMPLAVYLALETDPEAAITLSLLLLVVSVSLLVLLRGQWVARVSRGEVYRIVTDDHADVLVARLRVRLVDVELRLAAGETVALLGPNGAGKTTVLRALAGLLPGGGEITLAGERIEEAPPERRRIGMVFQDYLLFPHLSAVDNVAFGPRCAGMPRDAARALAVHWLEKVGLGGEHTGKRPGQLSGGQAQRVALARALVTEPRLLLLDEPLSALDARSRLEIRAQLRRHLAEYPGAALVVTHDPLDAMALADRILILEEGRLTQSGSPAEITSRPRTEYVATLVGLNLYRGPARDGVVDLGVVALTVDTPVSGDVLVAFPPSAVALYRSRPDGSPRNVWTGRVATLDRHGAQVRVQLAGDLPVAADVTPAACADLGLVPGAEVWAAVKAAETRAYPA